MNNLDKGVNEIIDKKFRVIEESMTSVVEAIKTNLEKCHLELIKKLEDYEKDETRKYNNIPLI